MLSISRLATALVVAGLFLPLGIVEAASDIQRNLRQPAAVYYQGRDDCPALCSASGPNPANWTAYHNLGQVSSCKETIFYHFSLYDAVDDNSMPHRVYACTSFGATKKPGAEAVKVKTAVQTINAAPFKLGRWDEKGPRRVDLRELSREMRRLLSHGYTATEDSPLVLFAQTPGSTAGLYMGKSVQFQSTASDALVVMENALYASNNTSSRIAMQLCEDGYDGDHVFGFMATSTTSFTPVQQALQSWANATCLAFNTTTKVTSKAIFTAPLVLASNATSSNATFSNATSLSIPSMFRWAIQGSSLQRRDDCRTIQVASGNSCAALATRCGISPSDFTKYNPSSTLCSTLVPLQHVCCSAGTLPDFTPKQNADGSCKAYTVQADDTCSGIAAANSLKVNDLENYNKNTWAWSGCNRLFAQSIICLSSGTPPMPAPLANAVCGPQKPGTTAPAGASMDDISKLNPCPLNACCDVWGQCGITDDFCTDTNTGAPGTAEPNTNGCISNCGTNVVRSGAPDQFIRLGYYEGYSMGRPCLYQDARQIDTGKYTHLHFAFGVLSADYQVSVGDKLSAYEFDSFKRLGGVHRVLSFGGWSFSTAPSTYNIFRTGVTAANRLTMATNVANFVKANDLDGVDIDWEYPGAPDIPGIPPGNEDDGTNYLAFLVVLKNLLRGKTVSIAAPASYWYLKGFPIDKMAKVVDYIVFMTYDLHGQWDANNRWSQEGCPTGMCLRSHINMTETKTALSMITKAGVPSNKIVVGVTSYGRSFAMADPSCYGPNCLFTGTSSQSNADKGPCTDTAGYISNAEIFDIINGKTSDPFGKRQNRVNQNFIDSTSHSRIVVYDNNQWVAFMDDDILTQRAALYRGLAMGGTTNWATDLETYHDVPDNSDSWTSFRNSVQIGNDPYAEGDRHGNWSTIQCDDPAVQGNNYFSPAERWAMLDAADAWADAVKVWTDIDRGHVNSFTASIANTIHGPEGSDCGNMEDENNCGQTQQCQGFVGGKSGAAGYEIWNSMVYVHEIYSEYHKTLFQAAAASLDPALKDFENQFAPIPRPPDDTWLEILLAMVGLVGTVAVSGYFNTILKSLPFFKVNSVSYDNYKDTAKAMVSFSLSITSTLTGGDKKGWTVEKQDAFSDYMGQAVTAWANITETSLRNLFNGEKSSITLLTSIISDGKLISGSVDRHHIGNPGIPGKNDSTESDLRANISKAFFAFGIPQIWSVSGTRAFIIDSGYDCGTKPEDQDIRHMDAETMQATGACYKANNKLYYLVYPKGDSLDCYYGGPDNPSSCSDSIFSVPPGLDTLDGSRFGGVRLDDLITGALRTYTQNGNQNGGAATDPTDDGSLDDLMNQDVTTPGFIRIPVCSATVASAAWADAGIHEDAPNYPCYVKPPPPSISDCGDSTFEDRTSDASPSVADCQALVDTIKGTQRQWEVENAVGIQHELVHSPNKKCMFGVQGKGKNGNIDFHVGAQDIVDIIEDSIKKFGGSGKVGAKGQMSCRGTVKGQNVEWGLY